MTSDVGDVWQVSQTKRESLVGRSDLKGESFFKFLDREINTIMGDVLTGLT